MLPAFPHLQQRRWDRHTEFSIVDDEGYALLDDQCDRELPDDPLRYGEPTPNTIGIRIPWHPDGEDGGPATSGKLT